MPDPFDVTTVSNTLNLDKRREGIALFTIKNRTRRRLNALLRVTITPEEGAQWVTILSPDGKRRAPTSERDFAVDETQSCQVNVAVPADAAPGSYTLRLIVADEANPDDNFTASPDVVFTVLPSPPPDRRLPIILAVILVLLIVGVIIAIAVKNATDSANATATANAETTITLARQTADAQTQNALGTLGVLGTQNALNTQNAVATQNAVGTQNILNTQNAVRTQNAAGTQNAINTQNAAATRTAAHGATLTEAVHLTQTALSERLTDRPHCLLPNCP